MITPALKLALLLGQLFSFFLKQAGENELARKVTEDVKALQAKRTRRAADARADVESGRVPINPEDPYRRD